MHLDAYIQLPITELINILILFCEQEAELGSGASFGGDGEILDEVITRSRGEFRHISSPKITSSTATPTGDRKSLDSHRSFSPRVSELRGEHSPRTGGQGTPGQRSAEAKPSSLGKSPLNNTASK